MSKFCTGSCFLHGKLGRGRTGNNLFLSISFSNYKDRPRETQHAKIQEAFVAWEGAGPSKSATDPPLERRRENLFQTMTSWRNKPCNLHETPNGPLKNRRIALTVDTRSARVRRRYLQAVRSEATRSRCSLAPKSCLDLGGVRVRTKALATHAGHHVHEAPVVLHALLRPDGKSRKRNATAG